MAYGWIVVNQNKKTRIRTLYILKMPYTEGSTQFCTSTFGWLVPNQNIKN